MGEQHCLLQAGAAKKKKKPVSPCPLGDLQVFITGIHHGAGVSFLHFWSLYLFSLLRIKHRLSLNRVSEQSLVSGAFAHGLS